ncbi:hypothetical protein G9A89_023481 [Geosiphon pyriformis]|nr:hypothetical protein G9A89_023481 [Geosiphon pyriformis]
MLALTRGSLSSTNRILGNSKSALSSDCYSSSLKSYRKWSPKEIESLIKAHEEYGSKWELISQKYFPSRTRSALWQKWYNLKANPVLARLKLGPWTEEEDKKLCNLVEVYGKKWTKLSYILQRRPLYIQARYNRYLAPGTKTGRWTLKEIEILAEAFVKFGEDWEKIQELLPGRYLDRIKYLCRHSPKVRKSCNNGRWNSTES